MITRFLIALLAALTVGNNRGCESFVKDADSEPIVIAQQSAAQQQELERILEKWEQSTATTDNYRYTFRRWTYDFVFGPSDTFASYSEGVIEISMPDKWYFRVDKTVNYQAPRKPGESATYVPADESKREERSYDGDWLCEADFYRQRVIRTQVPPQRKYGLRILMPSFYKDSSWSVGDPLIFIGKIDRQDLKRQYQLRLLSPEVGRDDYRIQVTPVDSANVIHLMTGETFLDRNLCLPEAGIIYRYLTTKRRSQSRTVYEFTQGDPRVPADENFVISQVKLRHFWKLEERPWHDSLKTDGHGDENGVERDEE